MKVNEILESEQIDEIKLKHALASAALAAGIGMGAMHVHDTKVAHDCEVAQARASKDKENKYQKEISNLTDIVLDKYKISSNEAEKIVKLAKKHETETFPAKDLLAIIGIESSFNPNAKSHLKHDKAIGLTQIRPHIWGIHAKDIKGNIEKQISMSAEILNKYFKALGSKDKAVHAYNVGLTNVKHGVGLNPAYVQKWKTELKRYE